MAEVATGAEAEGSAKVKAAGSGEGTEPSSGAQHNANESGGSQQTNSVAFGSWEQPPPTNAQLLTPSLANAFGIELMNGYRYPAQPNGGRGSAHDSGNGVHSGNGANNPPARESSYGGGAPEHHAGAMAPPPGYGGFPHPGMHAPPGSQNAANAQAAAAVMAAASAMARGASGGHYASHYANLQHQYAQHYASRGGAPQGHYGADMYGRRSDGQQGMGAQQGEHQRSPFKPIPGVRPRRAPPPPPPGRGSPRAQNIRAPPASRPSVVGYYFRPRSIDRSILSIAPTSPPARAHPPPPPVESHPSLHSQVTSTPPSLSST